MKTFSTTGRLPSYFNITLWYPTLLVYTAVYDPTTGIVTPRFGDPRVPSEARLLQVKKEMGTDFGPTSYVSIYL
jgi:hypothetical protein